MAEGAPRKCETSLIALLSVDTDYSLSATEKSKSISVLFLSSSTPLFSLHSCLFVFLFFTLFSCLFLSFVFCFFYRVLYSSLSFTFPCFLSSFLISSFSFSPVMSILSHLVFSHLLLLLYLSFMFQPLFLCSFLCLMLSCFILFFCLFFVLFPFLVPFHFLFFLSLLPHLP